MPSFRELLLLLAFATSCQALVVHSGATRSRPLRQHALAGTQYEPASLRDFYADALEAFGDMGTAEELKGIAMPLVYKHEKAAADAVRAGFAEKDELKTQRLYVKFQAMMARAWGLMRMYPSFDAYWNATLPKHSEEVAVEDFKDKWKSLGIPFAVGSATRMPSLQEELGMAKEIDADGSGAISKRELRDYLYASFELGFCECGATFEGVAGCSDSPSTFSDIYNKWFGVNLDQSLVGEIDAAADRAPAIKKEVHDAFERVSKKFDAGLPDTEMSKFMYALALHSVEG